LVNDIDVLYVSVLHGCDEDGVRSVEEVGGAGSTLGVGIVGVVVQG